ncbi:hypothetical protein, partial [Sutterella wadsworthensis]|uniref:hypothetical protein n=1 Tax=Sutterella wadsworthensis TaxID=40545 RepID=UPI00307F0AFF
FIESPEGYDPVPSNIFVCPFASYSEAPANAGPIANAVNEAAIIVFFIKLSSENKGCSLFTPPPPLLSSALVFLMDSGVLKELSSDEAKNHYDWCSVNINCLIIRKI